MANFFHQVGVVFREPNSFSFEEFSVFLSFFNFFPLCMTRSSYDQNSLLYVVELERRKGDVEGKLGNEEFQKSLPMRKAHLRKKQWRSPKSSC